MFLSRSRSLKIKKKLFDKIKHVSWTSYSNLVSHMLVLELHGLCNRKYSFSNTSAKMNFASSMSNNLSWLYFLRCRSKKMISKEESINYFVEWLTDINKIWIIHTNLSASSDFPTYSEALPTLHKTRINCFPPAVLGTSPPFRQPWMGPTSHRYVFFEQCATLKGETLENGTWD